MKKISSLAAVSFMAIGLTLVLTSGVHADIVYQPYGYNSNYYSSNSYEDNYYRTGYYVSTYYNDTYYTPAYYPVDYNSAYYPAYVSYATEYYDSRRGLIYTIRN